MKHDIKRVGKYPTYGYGHSTPEADAAWEEYRVQIAPYLRLGKGMSKRDFLAGWFAKEDSLGVPTTRKGGSK